MRVRRPRKRARPRPVLAAVLFAVTFLTTTTLGAVWWRLVQGSASPDLIPWVSLGTVRAVWGDPELLGAGLTFSIASLGILWCHEMGHWLACRRYRLPSTLPYFLPAPVAIGTFGAFIRIRSPIRTKRELFDVGISGPLAGFVVLIPILLVGVARSTPATLSPGSGNALQLVPGNCLALELATRLFHGPLPEGVALQFHPLALAAWFGLLATALNLLPLGQLDGGHVLYAVLGRTQRRLAWPLWLLLAAAGFLWTGWFLWCAILLVMGLRHPPVRDEHVPLDPARRRLAWAALAVLVLSFMPIPVAAL